MLPGAPGLPAGHGSHMFSIPSSAWQGGGDRPGDPGAPLAPSTPVIPARPGKPLTPSDPRMQQAAKYVYVMSLQTVYVKLLL